MGYNISELDRAKQEFRSIFHAGLGAFIEKTLTAVTAQVTIDIVKFDKFLRKEHPNEDNLSLYALVEKHYGPQGNELMDKLF